MLHPPLLIEPTTILSHQTGVENVNILDLTNEQFEQLIRLRKEKDGLAARLRAIEAAVEKLTKGGGAAAPVAPKAPAWGKRGKPGPKRGAKPGPKPGPKPAQGPKPAAPAAGAPEKKEWGVKIVREMQAAGEPGLRIDELASRLGAPRKSIENWLYRRAAKKGLKKIGPGRFRYVGGAGGAKGAKGRR